MRGATFEEYHVHSSRALADATFGFVAATVRSARAWRRFNRDFRLGFPEVRIHRNARRRRKRSRRGR